MPFAVRLCHTEAFRRHPQNVRPFGSVCLFLDDGRLPLPFLRQRQEACGILFPYQHIPRRRVRLPHLEKQRGVLPPGFGGFFCFRLRLLLRLRRHHRVAFPFRHVFPDSGCSVSFPVPGDEERLHPVDPFDQAAASIPAQGESGRGQCVPGHGAVGKDGYGSQLVLHRPAGPAVQNVVINRAILLKSAFVDSAGYRGSSVVQRNHHGGPCRLVDVLDSNPPAASVRFRSDGHHVPAEGQDGALNAAVRQLLLHRVRDISLGDSSQVDHHSRRQGNLISLDPDLSVIHPGSRLLQGFRVRNLFFSRCKVPEDGRRGDGNVKRALRHFAHLYRRPQDFRRFRGNGHRFPLCVVDFPYVAAFHRAAQHFLILAAQGKPLVQQFRMIRIRRQGNDRIQIKADSGLFGTACIRFPARSLFRRGALRRRCRFRSHSPVSRAAPQQAGGRCQKRRQDDDPSVLFHALCSPVLSG